MLFLIISRRFLFIFLSLFLHLSFSFFVHGIAFHVDLSDHFQYCFFLMFFSFLTRFPSYIFLHPTSSVHRLVYYASSLFFFSPVIPFSSLITDNTLSHFLFHLYYIFLSAPFLRITLIPCSLYSTLRTHH